jgi:hypothetical protein
MPSDFDFDHLEPSAERRHTHTMHGVHVPPSNPKPVTLSLKFCGRGSPFWNARMKLKPLTDQTEASLRIAALFARHGVDGWENVAIGGQAKPYSPELGAEMFTKLIEKNRLEYIDAALGDAQNPDNFTPPLVEAGELGKK